MRLRVAGTMDIRALHAKQGPGDLEPAVALDAALGDSPGEIEDDTGSAGVVGFCGLDLAGAREEGSDVVCTYAVSMLVRNRTFSREKEKRIIFWKLGRKSDHSRKGSRQRRVEACCF